MRQRGFRNSVRHPPRSYVSHQHESRPASQDQYSHLSRKGMRGGEEVASGGSENSNGGRDDWHPLPNAAPLPACHSNIQPTSTNRHGMCYIKYNQTSKIPGSCWKGMRHIKWNLLLKRTPGLGFLAAVTQAALRGLTAGLDRTSNAQAAPF